MHLYSTISLHRLVHAQVSEIIDREEEGLFALASSVRLQPATSAMSGPSGIP